MHGWSFLPTYRQHLMKESYAAGAMHELSIAQSILKTVEQETEARGLPPVVEVGVRVGALSGVLPDALAFGFEALVAGTARAGCRLKIEPVPAQAQCRACNHAFDVADFFFQCPACGSAQVAVTYGYELDIAYLEVEDPEEQGAATS